MLNNMPRLKLVPGMHATDHMIFVMLRGTFEAPDVLSYSAVLAARMQAGRSFCLIAGSFQQPLVFKMKVHAACRCSQR